MIRALAKGAGLAAFGLFPGGERLYRRITRDWMDTQRSHIVKLHRVWPGTFGRIRAVYGEPLGNTRIYIHEAEWTPFWPCINFLVTGSGGVLVNSSHTGSTMLMRHLIFAINQALDLVGGGSWAVPRERVDRLNSLRWCHGLDEFFEETGSRYLEGCPPDRLGLDDGSVDIIYSGGQLEHYPPALLDRWLDEAMRVLRPGGLLAPVIDHRDHLFHFDHRIPFLNHYRYPDAFYRLSHRTRLLYHSRLPPQELAAVFGEKGFTRRELWRLVLPDHEWIPDGDPLAGTPGLPRRLLSRRFADISRADLHTAAGHYIFQKPGTSRGESQ
jgi:hypothetical protein